MMETFLHINFYFLFSNDAQSVGQLEISIILFQGFINLSEKVKACFPLR